MSTNPFWSSTLCTGEGLWKISEALNTSQTFHIIEGLEPGTEYTVRLIPNSRVDNSSIFEDVISTGSAGEEGNKKSLQLKQKQEKEKQAKLIDLSLSSADAPSASLSSDFSRGVWSFAVSLGFNLAAQPRWEELHLYSVPYLIN